MGRKKKEKFNVELTEAEKSPEVQAEVNQFMKDYKGGDIDHEPREPKETKDAEAAEQLSLIKKEKEEHEAEVKEFEAENPRTFAFEMRLVIKPQGGRPFTLPIAAGACPGDCVEDYLNKRFHSNKFRGVLRAICGDPAPRTKKDEQPKTEQTISPAPALEVGDFVEVNGDAKVVSSVFVGSNGVSAAQLEDVTSEEDAQELAKKFVRPSLADEAPLIPDDDMPLMMNGEANPDLF